MKPTADLFLLIHSMTKAEKGYFKKFKEKHKKEGNHYLKLFDAINAQASYNEASLIKKFRKESFIKQFAFYKNYLYNQILKSLVVYHADNTATASIFELISMAEFLISRGLVVQAKKPINEAKILAIKYDKNSLLQDILVLEMHVFYRLGAWNKKAIDKIETVYTSQKDALKKTGLMIDNMYKCNYVFNRFFVKGKAPIAYKTTDAEIGKMIAEMEREEGSKYQSFDSLRVLYYTGGFFYGSLGDGGEKSNYYLKKLAGLLEANPHQLKEKIRNYTDQLYDCMQSALYIRNIKDFKTARAKLLALQNNLPQAANTEFNKLKIPVIIIHSDLYYYYRTCQFEKVTDVIHEISKTNILQKIGSASALLYGGYFYLIRLQIIYNIGCLLFYCSDYHKALKWLSELWNDKEDKALYPEVYYSFLLSVICHYETGNITSMKYLISTITKSISGIDRFEKIEKIFCTGMLQLADSKAESEKLKVLKRMKDSLMPHEVLLQEFVTFDMLLWIESKIQRKPAGLFMRKQMKLKV